MTHTTENPANPQPQQVRQAERCVPAHPTLSTSPQAADPGPFASEPKPAAENPAPCTAAAGRPTGQSYVQKELGLQASIKMGWVFTKFVLQMGLAHRRLLGPAIFLAICAALFVPLWFIATLNTLDPETYELFELPFWFVTFLGGFTLLYFFSGMTAHLVSVHLSGGEASLKEAFRDARKNLLALVAISLLASLVHLVLMMIYDKKRRSGFMWALQNTIETTWTTLSYLVLPAIIIEDCSLREALAHVRRIHKNNLLPIAVGEVSVQMVTTLIGFYALIIGFLPILLGLTSDATLGFALPALALILASALSMFVRTAYYTCLYIWAKHTEVERIVGIESPAPTPLAQALGIAPTAPAF